jgi:Leishmanolysin
MTPENSSWQTRLCLLITAVTIAGTSCRSNNDTSGLPAAISVVAGANQQAAVGTPVTIAPSVRVQDGGGSAVSGATVRFTIASGGGTVIGDSAVTDVNGRATVGEWIMGTAPGANTLRAAVSGTSVSITVPATAVAGTGVSLRSAGQQGFLALAGQPVTPAPSVLVLDSFGNPVPGVSVTFTVAQGGGSVTGAVASSNASGVAQVGSWTLGSAAGLNVLVARIASGPTVSFTARALTSAPLLSAVSAVAQSGYLSFPVTTVPRVLVTDASGQPLAGAPVTFTVSSGDATVSGGTATADASGIASPTDWRLGVTSSSTLTATTGLGAAPLTFSATGVPASFLIDVRFLTSMTADERDAFVAAARRWMGIITAHLTPVTVNLPAAACAPLQPAMSETIPDLVVFAEVTPIDGAGGVLGSSGPCAERSTSNLPAVGTMQFDTADLPALERTGQLVATITHEMGHVLGFGTIWSDAGLTSGTGTTDPIFTGTEALAQWPPFATALGYAGRPVPLENTGSAGTRDVHWRESVFHAELMTGFIEAAGVPMPLSKMTVASLKDLGYQVDYSQADVFVGHLVAAGASTSPPTMINERLGRATWEVSPDGVTRKIQ